MTSEASVSWRWTWLLAAIAGLVLGASRAEAEDLKLEAQLVWGTLDAKSPDPRHKPVAPDVLEKLKDLPLKWTHYFEVNRQGFDVSQNGSKKVSLSDKCQLEVKHLGDTRIEVALFGRGEQVVKRTQKLPKGEILVLGGNAPNSTAWLVILKRIQ